MSLKCNYYGFRFSRIQLVKERVDKLLVFGCLGCNPDGGFDLFSSGLACSFFNNFMPYAGWYNYLAIELVKQILLAYA